MNYFQLLGPFLLATFSVCFFLIWRRFPDLRSALFFALSHVCLTLALTFEALRGTFGPNLTTYSTNIPYLVAAIFYAAGICALCGREAPWRRSTALALVTIAAVAWFRHIDEDVVARTLVIHFGLAAIIGLALALSLRQKVERLKRVILWCLVAAAGLSLARVLLTLRSQGDTLSNENYASSLVAWTIQLSVAMGSLVIAVLIFAHYGLTVIRRLAEENARNLDHVRKQMSKFLSPAVVADLLENDNADLTVQPREITALMVDLRGFTAFSEAHGADAASRRANAFFSIVSEEILARDGTIDKYLGDAVLAFWNAPIAQPDHCDRAVATASAIQTRLAALAEPMEAVAMIETGRCNVGNFGTAQRMDYTAIGGAMNTVSRLEAQAKRLGVPVLIGPQAARCTGAQLDAVGQVALAGLKDDLPVFRPA